MSTVAKEPNAMDFVADLAEALADISSASLDLAQALRAGRVTPESNLGSGATALDLLCAATTAVCNIQRVSQSDWILISEAAKAIGLAVIVVGKSHCGSQGNAAAGAK